MHMAVGNLFCRRGTYTCHRRHELQRHTRQRVVAVQQHFRALDLDHAEGVFLAVIRHAAQAAADLHAGWEFGLGDGLHQALVALTKGVFGRQGQADLEAGFLAVQCSFHLGEDVVVATVQVDHGRLAGVDQGALGVCHLVAQGDNGVLGDFHVRPMQN